MPLAKPNYAFQKRQRELAKKQKKEEKRLRKAEAVTVRDDTGAAQDEGAATTVPLPDEQAPAGADDGEKA